MKREREKEGRGKQKRIFKVRERKETTKVTKYNKQVRREKSQRGREKEKSNEIVCKLIELKGERKGYA